MREEIIAVNQRLLDCIAAGDWDTYTELCDDSLTCFEPETHGHLVGGLEFHKFYFDNGYGGIPRAETMVEPHVRNLGETAVLSYVRLVQTKDATGKDVTLRFSETRIWSN